MKSSYLRAGAVLACTLALSACGGSDGDLLLGGSFSGVTKPGLVLTNNGGSDYAVPVPANGTGTDRFYFPNLVSTDDQYNVEVKARPDNTSKCDVINGRGRAAFNITTVQIVCTIKTHKLTGTISNLKGQLELVNGADKIVVPAGATSFAMTPVFEDAVYGVTVLKNPEGQTCSIANGSGVMRSTDVTNLAVTCTP